MERNLITCDRIVEAGFNQSQLIDFQFSYVSLNIPATIISCQVRCYLYPEIYK